MFGAIVNVIEVQYPWITETGSQSVYYGSLDEMRIDATRRYRAKQIDERSNPIPIFECERPSRVHRCFPVKLNASNFANILNSHGSQWCKDAVEIGKLRFMPHDHEIIYHAKIDRGY